MPTSYKTNVVLCKLYGVVRSPTELIFGIAILGRSLLLTAVLGLLR